VSQGRDQPEPLYRWSKEFLEAGKKRLAGDTAREATSDEVKELKVLARQLKETLADVLIEPTALFFAVA
jgi:transposase